MVLFPNFDKKHEKNKIVKFPTKMKEIGGTLRGAYRTGRLRGSYYTEYGNENILQFFKEYYHENSTTYSHQKGWRGCQQGIWCKLGIKVMCLITMHVGERVPVPITKQPSSVALKCTTYISTDTYILSS